MTTVLIFAILEVAAGAPSTNDILLEKGFFTAGQEAAITARTQTVESGTPMTDWTLLMPTRYTVGSSTETLEDTTETTAITLTKADGESNFGFDDGLVI